MGHPAARHGDSRRQVGAVTLEVWLQLKVPADIDGVTVPVFAGAIDGAPEARFLASCGFGAQLGESVVLPPQEPDGPARVVVGVGRPDAVDAPALRAAGAQAARASRRYPRMALTVPQCEGLTAVEATAAMVEGFLLGAYQFTRYRRDPGTQRLDVLCSDVDDELEAEVARAQVLARGVCLARDLGNEPGGSLTPVALAERAQSMAGECGLSCEVWDQARIEAERLGGLLGVNRGSAQPPRMVKLTYQPEAPQGTVALVGKGVTFDSGGLTVKPITMMFDMKLDMAGAAAVLGALSVARTLSWSVRVVAWLPLTDNMSGGDAMRLGDVLRTRNGTTVEVINADAEGRLLLADGLALAAEEHPDAIVDIATLTDTVPMALGRRYAGLAGNHAGWQEQVAAAARRAGECVWPLPLVEADRHRLDSKVADLINCPHYRYGQSTLAALFLRQFVPARIPWAHLDINGPAATDDEEGVWVSGATGFGVRTLVELLGSYQPPSS
jgi:leucyl aminopeptidase